jgi:hypothetical protein
LKSKRGIYNIITIVALIVGLAGIFISVDAYNDINKAIVDIEWSTSSELETVGYNIMRSDNQQGPYIKINDELILASSTPLTGHDYQYQDHDVIPGTTYYYKLQDIGIDGQGSFHGPIKIRAENQEVQKLVFGVLLLLVAIAIPLIYQSGTPTNMATR